MSSVQEHPTAFLSSFSTTTASSSLPSVAVRKDSRTADLLCGSVAGCFGKFIEFPFDTVKVRLQTQQLGKLSFKGPWDCLQKTVGNEGFRGLYKGLSTPLVGAMMENAMLFVCYNHIQKMIRGRNYNGPLDSTGSGTEPLPLSIAQLCTAGALSGAAVSFLLTPIELIKCQLQVSQLNQHNISTTTTTGITTSAPATGSSIPSPKLLAAKTYQGPVSVALHNLRTRGLLGFYRGHTGTFLRETGGGAAWFGVYEVMCRWLVHRKQTSIESSPPSGSYILVTKDDLGPAQLMMAGALAGMAFNAILFPADVVKSQMQTEGVLEDITKPSKKPPRSFNTVASDIWRLEGPKGFFRGFGITVGRSAPTSAVIFMTYEMLTRNFARVEAEG